MTDDPSLDSRPNIRFSGWKEISSRLGRGVRTAQRWEKDYGLPIRRLGLGRGETVFAFSQDIDDWLATAEAESAWANEAKDSAEDGEPDDPSDEGKAEGWQAWLIPDSNGREGRSAKRTFVLIALLVACVALGVIGYHFVTTTWLLQNNTTPSAAPESVPLKAEPASFRVDFDTLIVYESSGVEIWRWHFGFELDAKMYTSGGEGWHQTARILDIDGDSHREVIIIPKAPGGASPDRSALFVFNSDGTLRWSFQLPAEMAVQFGTEQFAGPWVADRWFITAAPKDSTRLALWLASHHAVMYPASLQRLNPQTGGVMTNYWSNGHILSLSLERLGGNARLLVGACNNETKGASLAVLDPAKPNGTAPSKSPQYRCDGCIMGKPLTFLLFPKPRRFAGIEASSCTHRIEKSATGFNIGVRHVIGAEHLAADAYYMMDNALRLTRVDTGDGFNSLYNVLVREKTISEYTPARGVDPTSEFLPLLLWNGSDYTPVGKAASTSLSAR